MEGNLLKLPTDKLLEKFGSGNHKPGSGSAAAYQGMLSAQLTRTVISLTNEEKRRKNYAEWLPELLKFDAAIETHIYPELQRLFQADSDQFDTVIKTREARNNEPNTYKRQQLADKAVKELMTATEMPIEIANLCIGLAIASLYVFEHGFKSARGDSGVAFNSALSAVAGCLSIIDLNLLSFTSNDWTVAIRPQVEVLREKYYKLQEEGITKLDELRKEAEEHNSFQEAVNTLFSGIKENPTNADIEVVAINLQNLMWKYRSKIWQKDIPELPVQILNPDTAIRKIIGYKFYQDDSIGQYEVDGDVFEIAGLIDKSSKTIHVSKQFPFETQNFTAAHELGHAFFHKQTVMHRDKAIDGSSSLHRNIRELQADKFAAYFLMPQKQVIAAFKRLFSTDKFALTADTTFALTGGRTSSVSTFKNECENLRGLAKIIASTKIIDNSDGITKSLSDIFQVSITTMAIRLEELNLVEF